MDTSWIIAGLVAIVCCLSYRYLIYPALLSPLAKIPPAHPLCTVTSKWFQYQATHSRELKTLYAAHNTYGPIVRLAPNEISVVSLEGLRKVYVAGLDKSDWYQRVGLFMVYGVQNLVCTLDHATHSRIRKALAPLYAKSYLQRSAALEALSRKIISSRLMPMLQTFAREEQYINVVELFEWISVDFISGYVFQPDGGTDFLQDISGRDEYMDEWKRLRIPGASQEKPITEDLYMRMCEAALSNEKASRSEQATPVAKMHAGMLANAKQWNLSEDEIMSRVASEMVDHVVATQLTQTTMWTYVLYRLSQRPKLQEDLRAELETLDPPVPYSTRPLGDGIVEDDKQALPTPSRIDSLPLLDAVVRETLRLHAGNPARMPRVVPAGGLELHGCFIPPGTTVSTNAYCLHRNAEAFPEPLEWRPERWRGRENVGEVEDEGMAVQDRWFWAFGSGPRMCIGQHFAVQVLKLVVAAIYTHFTTTIVDDAGIEQSDSYNSEPVSHRLTLQFHDRHGADVES